MLGPCTACTAALAFHHAHAPGGPGEDEVGIEALPRHRVVAGAGRVVHREHDLRHARRRHRLDEARAGADDALVLRLGADHEAARRPARRAAGCRSRSQRSDEVRDLLGALGVDDAAEARRLAGAPLMRPRWFAMTPTGDAVDARVAADHLAARGRPGTRRARRRRRCSASTCVHVVRHAVIGGQQIVERRRRARPARRLA